MKSLKTNPWQAYMAHQQKREELEEAFLEGFWSNYSQQIEQNKALQAQNQPLITQGDALPYIQIFERYWQGKDKIISTTFTRKFPASQILLSLAIMAWLLMSYLPPESPKAGICSLVMILAGMFGFIFLFGGNPGFFRLCELELMPDCFTYTVKSKKQTWQQQVRYQNIHQVEVSQQYLHVHTRIPQLWQHTPRTSQKQLHIPHPKDDKTLHFLRLFLEDICLVKSLKNNAH